MQYEVTYWLIGVSSDRASDIARFASIVRAAESAGQAVSYGITSTSLVLEASAGINLGLCLVAIPPAWFFVRKVGITPEGEYLYRPPMYTEEERSEKPVQETTEKLADSRVEE